MNKIKYALLLCTILLLCIGCGKDKQTNDNMVGTEATGVESTESDGSITQPTEEIMGVVDSPFDNEDMTEQRDGNDVSGNGASSGGNSSSGGNGQSNTGSGNSGNQGNSGSNGNTGNGSQQGGSNGGDTSNGGSNTEKPTQPGGETATEPVPTEPKPTEPKPAEPQPTQPGTTEPSSEIEYVSYEEYNNMAPEEQMAYYNQFPSMEAFVKWYNEAKAKYDEEHGAIDVGDGNIDIGDIINP